MSDLRGAEWVEVELIPLSFTERAVQCDVGQDSPVWIPLSQFETPPDKSDRNELGCYEVSDWIANEKGLI